MKRRTANPIDDGALAGSLSRALSLTAAAALSLALMIYPYALGNSLDRTTHVALPVLLLGIALLLIRRV